jgi:hypothetical protein
LRLYWNPDNNRPEDRYRDSCRRCRYFRLLIQATARDGLKTANLAGSTVYMLEEGRICDLYRTHTP